MKYNCKFCGHQFKQKNDLQRHLDKKNGCIPVNKIIEKAKINHLVNAGVYVANKAILKNLTKNKKLMMNEFITQQLKNKKKVFSYPVYENWIDIGNKIDFYNYR